MTEVWPPLQQAMDEAQAYPMWVCADCAKEYGRHAIGIATWHKGTCGVCGRVTGVTEPRDCGHLRNGWQAHGDYNTSDGRWRTNETE
jgi:hypothetical protein